jgi:SWI/SNF-related matrix-associated actin-dependent regulator of chromatin subfamily A-like protein 1
MTKPFPYQIEDAKKIHKMKGRALVASEMGTGKSYIALRYAFDNNRFPLVIVCPASLKWNWSNECSTHFRLRSQVLEGMKPKRNKLPKSKVYIINYDILKGWIEKLKDIQPKLIIADECHMLANKSAQRTKAIRKLCEGVPHVVALSGTPLISRPSEMWPTLNLLRDDLFPSFFSYAHKHCGAKRMPWGWSFKGATRLKELNKSLVPLMIRRKKSEVLKDLPEKIRQVIPVKVKGLKEYIEAEQDFAKWLQKNKPENMEASLKAEAIVKLGYLKRLAGKLKFDLTLEWIDNFLKESKDKLLVFGVHRDIVEGTHEAVKGSVMVHGGVIGSKRELARKTFQTSKACRLFVGNIRAAGVGLNLTAASTVFFSELDWTPGAHSQAEDRAHRIHMQGSYLAVYMVAMHTIEVDLLEIIERKQKVISNTLDGGRQKDDIDVYQKLMKKIIARKR